ncbi:UvrD-helicase domain-containing protein [Stappia indica]|uniref:UvrD-helicase domain-containing protein n=1 Tax=Stappia indica TaxID=538381 RepID=UPI001CD2AD23|nr:UvrD-helicase domain-containing protein [Stappia indica]MCA1297722.1 UvrD-helicase domain-containing protein [Stappia indica]
MKYICIDNGAINELISGRQMQSVDFREGAAFVELLSGGQEGFRAVGDIVMTTRSDGLFLSTSGGWTRKKFLIIDCESSEIFEKLDPSSVLTVLQKSFRFCAKYWSGNGVYNASEKIISGTTKAVLFPLGFSKASGFRVALERDPDAKRLRARDISGNFILLYKSGFEGADSGTEIAPLTNFRRVVDCLREVYSSVPENLVAAAGKEEKRISDTILSSASLGTGKGAFLPLEQWKERLTEQQWDFVNAPFSKAQRLIGAAGTGKTATLLIRSLLKCAEAEEGNSNFRAIFITHSEATRRSALEVLEIMAPGGYHTRDPEEEAVSLSVKTLATVCSDVLNQSISDTEFVDRDAQDSKMLQGMYIEQSLRQAREAEFGSHSPHMSEVFRDFLTNNIDTDLAPLFQHEISVQIKGRAGGKFDAYKECPALKYGLPVSNDADKGFVYVVFRLYEEELRSTGQFDTDDVVLSALGQLDTPIWRRRRSREGFDYIGVDEAHLFNINELQVFHYLTKGSGTAPISLAIDKAQAVGDRGWDAGYLEEGGAFGVNGVEVDVEEVRYKAVFRSSSEIVDFSASILSSGATLFTDFSNSLASAQSGLTAEEEKLSQPIRYREESNDLAMIEAAFRRASELQRLTQSRPWEVLVTAVSEGIAAELARYARENNKAVTVLDRRGDYFRVKEAEKSGHLIVGHADFVGGLEFNAVIIVGVDKGRVPLDSGAGTLETRSFQKYVAHNRLYVAASRARLALEIFGLAGRGPSELLKQALGTGLINPSAG